MEPIGKSTETYVAIDLKKSKSNSDEYYNLFSPAKDISRYVKVAPLAYAPAKSTKLIFNYVEVTNTVPTAMKGMKVLGTGAAIAYGTYETVKAYNKGGKAEAIKTGTKVAGGIVGAYAGAKAAVATASPVIAAATAVNPILGGATAVVVGTVGGVIGYYVGKLVIDLHQPY